MDFILTRCSSCSAINKIPTSKTSLTIKCGKCHTVIKHISENGKFINLSDSFFIKEILGHDGPAIVNFWADKCEKSKNIEPMLSSLADEYPNLKVARLNIDENNWIPTQYSIKETPTTLVFNKGKLLHKITGIKEKRVLDDCLKEID